MPAAAKPKSKVNRKSRTTSKPKAGAKKKSKPKPQAPILIGGTDWAEEIDLLFTDLARELCDTPDKCKMLVVRVTLRDGSEYLISGHGERRLQHPNGMQEVVCMHFLGQDSRKRRVALAVQPEDVFKIELVDVPEQEERPPFGFATRIQRGNVLEKVPQ